MSLVNRLSVVALTLGLVVGLGSLPSVAQITGTQKGTTKAKGESSPSSKAGEEETSAPIAKRIALPRYFGQVALSQQQRDQIAKVQRKHQARLEELEREIEQTKATMLGECEAVLTPVQRQLLSDLRKAEKSKK